MLLDTFVHHYVHVTSSANKTVVFNSVLFFIELVSEIGKGVDDYTKEYTQQEKVDD